uniref:Uncharacterized protein n=1 Tax=Ixodes ricinus TaxID=34613 RepID=A0A147BP61_IXORI
MNCGRDCPSPGRSALRLHCLVACLLLILCFSIPLPIFIYSSIFCIAPKCFYSLLRAIFLVYILSFCLYFAFFDGGADGQHAASCVVSQVNCCYRFLSRC